MRFLMLFVLAGLASLAQAPRPQGHAYLGIDNPPNGNFNFNSVGIGGDIFIYKGAAFSPAGGWVYNCASIGRGAAASTRNGSYHFLRGTSPFEPFVTAGYRTLTNFGDAVSLLNYGGSGQYWFSKHLGVRVELLNFQHWQYRGLTSVRFGIAFR